MASLNREHNRYEDVGLLPWARTMFEGAINASCQVTIRPRSGGSPLKEVGELYGAPQRCSPPPFLGHWHPSNKLRRVVRSISPGPLEAARDAGLRVYVLSREAFRSFKHEADVQTPSAGARDGGRYPHVIVPRPPFRVVKCPTAVSA